jgi:predicted TIM-barrel fold metal-dependent hydrolase
MDYVRKGNLFFSTEADDVLLPQVIELIGEDNMVFGSDMPHGDREPFVVRKVKERRDIAESAKLKILEKNPARLYGLHLS